MTQSSARVCNHTQCASKDEVEGKAVSHKGSRLKQKGGREEKLQDKVKAVKILSQPQLDKSSCHH